jgi:hypothetical protein
VKAGQALRVVAWRCSCVKCGHVWQSDGDEPPAYCAGCRNGDWWIKRPVGRPPSDKAAAKK